MESIEVTKLRFPAYLFREYSFQNFLGVHAPPPKKKINKRNSHQEMCLPLKKPWLRSAGLSSVLLKLSQWKLNIHPRSYVICRLHLRKKSCTQLQARSRNVFVKWNIGVPDRNSAGENFTTCTPKKKPNTRNQIHVCCPYLKKYANGKQVKCKLTRLMKAQLEFSRTKN